MLHLGVGSCTTGLGLRRASGQAPGPPQHCNAAGISDPRQLANDQLQASRRAATRDPRTAPDTTRACGHLHAGNTAEAAGMLRRSARSLPARTDGPCSGPATASTHRIRPRLASLSPGGSSGSGSGPGGGGGGGSGGGSGCVLLFAQPPASRVLPADATPSLPLFSPIIATLTLSPLPTAGLTAVAAAAAGGKCGPPARAPWPCLQRRQRRRARQTSAWLAACRAMIRTTGGCRSLYR